MEAGTSKFEVEIKLRVPDAAAGRGLLESAGFMVREERVYESNTVYDTADQRLRSAEKLLRVRQVGDAVTLTYKGPGLPGKHKKREEIELTLSDAGAFDGILRRLGMAPSFRYEKYRTEYDGPEGSGIAMLDETPIGAFLELEGPPDWIDSMASLLGYSVEDYITTSYGQLYLESRAPEDQNPAAMVFGSRGN